MDDTLVTDVSGDIESNRSQREQSIKKLELLERGLEICKHFTSEGLIWLRNLDRQRYAEIGFKYQGLSFVLLSKSHNVYSLTKLPGSSG